MTTGLTEAPSRRGLPPPTLAAGCEPGVQAAGHGKLRGGGNGAGAWAAERGLSGAPTLKLSLLVSLSFPFVQVFDQATEALRCCLAVACTRMTPGWLIVSLTMQGGCPA